MICQFCHEELSDTLDGDDHIAANWFECFGCKIIYKIENDITHIVCFNLQDYKGLKGLHQLMVYVSQQFAILYFIDIKRNMPSKFPFDFAQKCTPSNIEYKIKTYLTFS